MRCSCTNSSRRHLVVARRVSRLDTTVTRQTCLSVAKIFERLTQHPVDQAAEQSTDNHMCIGKTGIYALKKGSFTLLHRESTNGLYLHFNRLHLIHSFCVAHSNVSRTHTHTHAHILRMRTSLCVPQLQCRPQRKERVHFPCPWCVQQSLIFLCSLCPSYGDWVRGVHTRNRSGRRE